MVSPAVDDSQVSGGRKTTTTTTTNPLHPPEQGLKCPRCDSPNTKFCYYNNYSLTQPRHFCKTCRRYWTKGGALRNVPVGGGCRKNKKSKSSASTRLPLDPADPITGNPEQGGGGLKFLTGPSQPAVDFQLGVLPFSRLQLPSTSGVFSSNNNQFFSFADFSSATALSPPAVTTASSMMGFSYPTSSSGFYGEIGGGLSSMISSNTHSSVASSIESLSSINQDLHWKLQQQRLGVFFGVETLKESPLSAFPTPLLEQQPEPISLQVPDSTRADDCGGSGWRKGCIGNTETTARFLESSYTMPTSAPANSHHNNNSNNNTSSNGNNNSSNWIGIPAWNDMPQFTTLP